MVGAWRGAQKLSGVENWASKKAGGMGWKGAKRRPLWLVGGAALIGKNLPAGFRGCQNRVRLAKGAEKGPAVGEPGVGGSA